MHAPYLNYYLHLRKVKLVVNTKLESRTTYIVSAIIYGKVEPGKYHPTFHHFILLPFIALIYFPKEAVIFNPGYQSGG